MNEKIVLDVLYKIDIDFAEIYIIDENIKNFNKKVLVNTSTRVFNNKKYDTLYIIEPKTSYLVPLPKGWLYTKATIQNLIGETGIILQLVNEKYILMYNTNQNLVFLNKGIPICDFKSIVVKKEEK